MRNRELHIICKTGEKGNLLADMARIRAFSKDYPGSRVLMQLTVLEPECSAAIKTYYMRNVIPQIRTAMYENGERYSDDEVDKILRGSSPVCRDCVPCESEGKWHVRTLELNELSNAQMVEHLDFVRQFAAENYYLIIEDPENIIKA